MRYATVFPLDDTPSDDRFPSQAINIILRLDLTVGKFCQSDNKTQGIYRPSPGFSSSLSLGARFSEATPLCFRRHSRVKRSSVLIVFTSEPMSPAPNLSLCTFLAVPSVREIVDRDTHTDECRGSIYTCFVSSVGRRRKVNLIRVLYFDSMVMAMEADPFVHAPTRYPVVRDIKVR